MFLIPEEPLSQVEGAAHLDFGSHNPWAVILELPAVPACFVGCNHHKSWMAGVKASKPPNRGVQALMDSDNSISGSQKMDESCRSCFLRLLRRLPVSERFAFVC